VRGSALLNEAPEKIDAPWRGLYESVADLAD
jgi:hypothetical protein